MLRLLPVIALLAACAEGGGAPVGAAASGAVPWQGTLRCDPIPGLTTLALNQPVTVTVDAGRAQYQRLVRRGDSTEASNVAERGGGAVAADGAVVLEGMAQGRDYRYRARYEGVLPPTGGPARLTGAQYWEAGPLTGSLTRPCSLQLGRQPS